ncbi:serine carboxypeptidase-like 18, partial [Arachis ipaensis]|uniref:serine carboxypeptidase-like 18 n=2 Tax=Arachis TaxID=3817 RepID=UPI000A2B6F61
NWVHRVGENDDVQSFYYFIESENNPREDEIGPLAFQVDEYDGICLLILAFHMLEQNMLHLSVNQAYEFFRKWLMDHPAFLKNKVYIGGDSYSGILIPIIAHEILKGIGYCCIDNSGDHDMVVPFLATQAWIRSLNYSIVDDWRPWYTNGQVAGYTRTYSNAMTFATVKGGGHTAPEYKLEECLHMSNYIEEFNGSLPNLVLRPHSWTKVQIIPIYLGIFFFHFTKSFESFPSYLLLY